MRDSDVRPLLHSHLRASHVDEPDTLIVEELGLCNGSSRIDVAVVNGRLTGWEIKAPRDRLDRLPSQVEHYSMVCDEAWLVTDRPHLERAMALLPQWWGVMLLTEAESGQPGAESAGAPVGMEVFRDARDNPGRSPIALARLLWRAEAIRVLTDHGVPGDGLVRATRMQLWSMLQERLTVDELGDVVRAALKARSGWRERRPSGPRRPRRQRTFEVLSTLQA